MDEFWPDSEESMLQIFVFILVSIAYHYKDTYYNKQQRITSSIEGGEYLKEILQPRQVSAPQKLAIFLSICGYGMSQRVTPERFRHSLQTISR